MCNATLPLLCLVVLGGGRAWLCSQFLAQQRMPGADRVPALWKQPCTTAQGDHPEAGANKPSPGRAAAGGSPTRQWELPASLALLRARRHCPPSDLRCISPLASAPPHGSVSISSLNKYNFDVWSHSGLLNWLQNAFQREAAHFPLDYPTSHF